MTPDDLDPPRPVLKPVELQAMSISDLKAYIAALEIEIQRAAAMIASKQTHLSGADSLFRF